jgi:hypothetical protein
MTMAEESADAVEIDAGFEQVRGEGVAKTVDAAFGGDARRVARRVVDPLGGLDFHRAGAGPVGNNHSRGRVSRQ